MIDINCLLSFKVVYSNSLLFSIWLKGGTMNCNARCLKAVNMCMYSAVSLILLNT